MNLKLLLLFIPVLLLVLLMPLLQAEQSTYINFSEANIRFNGTDAVVTLYYDLTPAASIYVSFFGTNNLAPRIQDFFADFEDIEILSIRKNHAEVMVRNISTLNDEYYLHRSLRLPVTIKVLRVHTPNSQQTREYYNTNVTPNVFYPK